MRNRVALGEALAFVRQAAGEEESATYWLITQVQTARELGATWRDIGRSLSISHQAAWERFHAKIPIDSAEDTPDG